MGSHLIEIRLHKIISNRCCWDDYRFTFQILKAAGVSMEIAQQKVALTSGSSSSVSVLCFFAPQAHGMYRRHEEKHPAHIVQNQCTEQGVTQGTARVAVQRYMRVGTCDASQEPRSS